MTLPPYQKQGFGMLLIEFSLLKNLFSMCNSLTYIQAMNCPDVLERWGRLNDPYPTLGFAVTLHTG